MEPLPFQSTHPVRGGTCPGEMERGQIIISIHPPREGWDFWENGVLNASMISIHPPREGWDL